jgi:microcystin-dependent protein
MIKNIIKRVLAVLLVLLSISPSGLLADEEPYLGDIIMTAVPYTPRGWAECNGQFLSIAENPTLYSLIGDKHGSKNGMFALPDFRGRVPVGLDDNKWSYKKVKMGEHFGYESIKSALDITGEIEKVEAGTRSPDKYVKSITFGSIKIDRISNHQPSIGMRYIIAIKGMSPPKKRPVKWRKGNPNNYVGTIKLSPAKYIEAGWMECDGRELKINDYLGLYRVIGNVYGGNNRTTFRLPDLRGRVAMGTGKGPGLIPVYRGEQKGGPKKAVVASIKTYTTKVGSRGKKVQINGIKGDKTVNMKFDTYQPAVGMRYIISVEGEVSP